MGPSIGFMEIFDLTPTHPPTEACAERRTEEKAAAARAAAAMGGTADVAGGGDGAATLGTGAAVDVAGVVLAWRGALPKMLCVMA